MKRMLVLLLSLAIFCTLVPSTMADSWTCPDCGIENTGDYCGECGRYVHDSVEREITLVSSEDWFCLNCGNIGTSKFCTSCGSKRGKGLEGSFVRYGAYEQDGNINNGEEEIEWIVLEENNYSMTLLSLRLLDVQSFDASQATARWSDSSLREWLNDFFLQKAFSETEQKYFLPQSFSPDESDMVSLMPREMASVALIQREARIAEATAYAQNRAEGWIGTNSWFIIDDGYCGYVDGSKINQGTICVGGAKENMFVRPMIVIRNVPIMEELYQHGLVLLENEEYSDALILFESIRVYKDSAEKISFLEGVISEERYQYGLFCMNNERYAEAADIFTDLGDYKDSVARAKTCSELAVLENTYQTAIKMMENCQYDGAISAFEEILTYKDSAVKAEECVKLKGQPFYDEAVSLESSGKIMEAAIAFGRAGSYLDAHERSFALWDKFAIRHTITRGLNNGLDIGIKTDGSIIVSDFYAERMAPDIAEWNDIVDVASFGSSYAIGLKNDGTVVIANKDIPDYLKQEISKWENIVAISAGTMELVGLNSDGTVKLIGLDGSKMEGKVSDWKDIVAISVGDNYVVGLKVDGTVVANGDNKYGQCDVSGWKDIVAISASGVCTVGVRSNGSVLVAGGSKAWDTLRYISGWTDIVTVSSGYGRITGLKSDGTVVTIESNQTHEDDLSGWTNIVDISTSGTSTYGLRSDGTVLAYRSYLESTGHPNETYWDNIKLPQRTHLER